MSLDALSWSRYFRVFPGQGNLDVTTFGEAVVHAGYTGPLSLEIFNDVYRQADPHRVAVDACRSLRYNQDEVANRLGRGHEQTKSLIHLPPARAVHLGSPASGPIPYDEQPIPGQRQASGNASTGAFRSSLRTPLAAVRLMTTRRRERFRVG